jgi:hypothetical protein
LQEKEAEVVSKEVPAAPASRIGSKPSKILNISVNVNTWKSPGMVQERNRFSLQNNKVSQAENTEVCLSFHFLLRHSVIYLSVSSYLLFSLPGTDSNNLQVGLLGTSTYFILFFVPLLGALYYNLGLNVKKKNFKVKQQVY